ncbi:MAG: hypothetical protein EOP10_00390 [Proteobacteria bacterium]|nr:MAG: hypothetical protein EOP10_00390 [Pseudomonadota bacterium]
MQTKEAPDPKFAPGFRLLKHDKWAIGIFTISTIVFWKASPLLSFCSFMAAAHFFLFCNVFRIRRLPELIWSAVFLTTVYLQSRGHLSLMTMVTVCELVALILIAVSIRQKDYHGILWKKFNPELESWWKLK